MADKYSLLSRYWGYKSFRPLQEEIIDSVLSGHDTLALLPTGGGKSLCYQLPALMMEGVCLVVSPLVALMKDQVQQLNDKHLHASCIVAGMPSVEVTEVLYKAIAGQLKYLYVSPERLRQQMFIQHLRRIRLCLIAVDEAHCVSQWGYDFRPPYLQIADIRPYHPQTPLVALTATATKPVAQDIQEKLMMRSPAVFCGSFLRPNISYKVLARGDKLRFLKRFVSTHPGSGIVYVRSRRMTQVVAQSLQADGIGAMYYHAGLDTKERDYRQHEWMLGSCDVMVATNAFGMGIDKADVRYVIHLDIPDSLESYYQETGRAGRDGAPSEALLLYDEADILKCEQNFAHDYPSVKYIRNAYRALCNYYKIPLGSGAEASFDFDIGQICTNYRFNVREFYAACRVLERQGLVSLPELEDMKSTLFVQLNKEELYRFQVDHLAMGNLLQNIMRLYPGLFSEAVVIDEERIAKRSMLEAADVVAMLTQMKEMHVLDYRPRPKKPQIVFVASRVDETSLYFDDNVQLQQAARRRLDEVENYIKNTSRCRCQMLLSYFGEEMDEPCGKCDVCLSANESVPGLESAVMRILEGTKLPASDLEGLLAGMGFNHVTDSLRQMLDEGLLQLDENLRLGLA